MSQKARGGPQAGQIPFAPVKKAGLWMVIGALVLVALIIMAVYATIYRVVGKSPWRSEQKQSQVVSSTTQHPLQGTLELNSTTWQGVIVDGTECTDAKLITDNVWWEMRLDKNDSRVFRLYPRNWNEEKTLKIPDAKGANVIEWRIMPGQTINRGVLVFANHKKSEPHRFGFGEN